MERQTSIIFLVTLLLLKLTFVLSDGKHPLEQGVHVINKGQIPVPPQPPDTLLYSDNPYEPGKPWEKIGKEYCYPPSHSTERVTITRYEVSDIGGGGLAYDESGGVGHTQVCIYLKTLPGGSYRYNIKVYGYRTPSNQDLLDGSAQQQFATGPMQPQYKAGSMYPPNIGGSIQQPPPPMYPPQSMQTQPQYTTGNIQQQPQYNGYPPQPGGNGMQPALVRGFNQPQQTYGYAPPSPGTYPPPGYTQPSPEGYAQPPPGYAQTPPGYTQPPPGYAQTPPGYTQPPPGYAQTPPGYAQTPPGYTQPPPVVNIQPF